MAITVYWTCNEKPWLRAKAPESIYKNFIKDSKNKTNGIVFCPATKDYMQNIFGIQSLYSYNFKLNTDGSISAPLYDQEFFQNNVTIRSKEDRLFSFLQRFSFFTEEKSLLMSAGMLPFLEDNNITKRCTVIPGTFDIGKWFRQAEFAFYLKDGFDEFNIEEGEIFQYIRFHTKEKIIFKQFAMTLKIQDYFYDTENSKEFRKIKKRSLEEYYLMTKNKKRIIQEIKNNLVSYDG